VAKTFSFIARTGSGLKIVETGSRTMNARSHVFEVAVESCQVEDAVLSLFHPVLFHRTLGKFSYQAESSYSIGTIGYQDVDCHTIDHTYIRTYSPALDSLMRREVLSSQRTSSPPQARDLAKYPWNFSSVGERVGHFLQKTSPGRFGLFGLRL